LGINTTESKKKKKKPKPDQPDSRVQMGKGDYRQWGKANIGGALGTTQSKKRGTEWPGI